MAGLWGLPEVREWWLPSDESYPRILRSIRSFVEERATQPRDSPSSDVHNMHGIFKAMKLNDDGDGSRQPRHQHHQPRLHALASTGQDASMILHDANEDQENINGGDEDDLAGLDIGLSLDLAPTLDFDLAFDLDAAQSAGRTHMQDVVDANVNGHVGADGLQDLDLDFRATPLVQFSS